MQPKLFKFQKGQRKVPKIPPVDELEFLRLSGNHRDLSSKLAKLDCNSPNLKQYAEYICESWFRLGEQHLSEAKKLMSRGCPRATYSRAYYAAYNASKAVRYFAQGFVSLKGDDHGKASTDLPGDFPDDAVWAADISLLYQHRLHADYDNWSNTNASFTLAPRAAVRKAEEFIEEVRRYLKSKHGMTL